MSLIDWIGVLAPIALTAVGWLLNRVVKRLDAIDKSVGTLRMATVKMQESFSGHKAQSAIDHERIGERLDVHSELLRAHGNDIAGLKARVAYREADATGGVPNL